MPVLETGHGKRTTQNSARMRLLYASFHLEQQLHLPYAYTVYNLGPSLAFMPGWPDG
jgi:hypothetical protein